MWTANATGNSDSIKRQLQGTAESLTDKAAKDEFSKVKPLIEGLVTLSSSNSIVVQASGHVDLDKDGKRTGGGLTIHIMG